MDITALIIVIVVFLVILLILVVVFFVMGSGNRALDVRVPSKEEAKKERRSFAELAAIINRKSSSAEALQSAVDELIETHGQITDKLGIRPHPDFDRYVEIIFAVCRHRHTSKELILSLDKGLSDLNPAYRLDIDNVVQKGLNSRGM